MGISSAGKGGCQMRCAPTGKKRSRLGREHADVEQGAMEIIPDLAGRVGDPWCKRREHAMCVCMCTDRTLEHVLSTPVCFRAKLVSHAFHVDLPCTLWPSLAARPASAQLLV